MLQWVQYSNSVGFNFSGRARRSEYWYNCLFYVIISFVVSIVCGGLSAVVLAISDKLSFIAWILNGVTFLVGIFVFIKMLPIAIRRLHDTNKSGWVYLLCIVGNACCGIGSILLIIFMCMDSTPGTNQYGPNPKNNNGGYNQNMYGNGGQYYN